MSERRPFVTWEGAPLTRRAKVGLSCLFGALVLAALVPWWWNVIPAVLAVYGTHAMWMEAGQ